MQYPFSRAAIVKTFAATIIALAAVATTSKATLVFDDISNFRNGVTGATGTSTGSTPNTFMGDGYTLTPGTFDITGFDVYPVNSTGTNYTNLQISIYVWGSVNTGTVSASAPAFSNLLNSYTLTSAGTYTSGFYYSFEGATPGVTPGITLGTRLVIPSNTVGITLAYQGSTDGTTYASANNLTSLITTGTAPTVGSEVFNGYYRNAASETNGNFVSTLRSLGLTNQSLGLRVYGDVAAVPEPGTWAMIALGAMGMVAVRRVRTRRG